MLDVFSGWKSSMLDVYNHTRFPPHPNLLPPGEKEFPFPPRVVGPPSYRQKASNRLSESRQGSTGRVIFIFFAE